MIESVKDLQIVNGGQTTASIYHTWKKDKADIKDIVVQVKLSIVKDKNNFAEIVSRIAEYANTQNKISISDLSSNTPFHIELEKLSRNIWAPPVSGQSHQTRWFYERARGQYKNAMLREGTTKAKLKAFDFKNPKKQFFTKEELAKFINIWSEVYVDDKLVIGPHIVVRGSQKNYAQFVAHNIPENPDNKYFEEAIAKAILFRTAEKLYGIKPNSIGDMRYITVPYSLALLSYKKGIEINLSEIWKKQIISEELQTTIYNLMVQVEQFIKKNAPGALYGEWAKKEECWVAVKNSFKSI
uniref:AIPR family protein n=1 Tax=Chryseobacterium endophyticum TaxID=1854762 RepID=A0AAU6WVL6_9FLAO